MISFNQAYKIVMDSAVPLGTEVIEIENAIGRVLAADVVSDIDMPPFNKSAMDGYACRRSDLTEELQVVEILAAGAIPTKPIAAGKCAKVMTGGVIPAGADCVIMVEMTEQTGPATVRFTGNSTLTNICRRAEDVEAGDIVLQSGTIIEPQHIAVLASVGCVQFQVWQKPKVGIIATGDELVEPFQKPAGGQIRNSNSCQLQAQISQANAISCYYGIAVDTRQSLNAIISDAGNECDVLLLSGGVSMGDFDLVPEILKSQNVKLLFEKIAIKPGKPTIFGIAKEFFCFGLPGNPVSTFVLFELLVKPFLYKLMDADYVPKEIKAKLAGNITRKKTERDSWIPVTLSKNGTVEILEYHGSAHIKALTQANGLICIPAGQAELKEGQNIVVRQI